MKSLSAVEIIPIDKDGQIDGLHAPSSELPFYLASQMRELQPIGDIRITELKKQFNLK